jgi:hypothetical protein
MVDNGVQLGIVDHINLYCYTITTGSYQQSNLNSAEAFGIVSDFATQGVAGATTITFLNGRCTAEKAGSRQAYTSGSYDITAWGGNATHSALIFFTKENAADLLVAVEAFNGTMILWGDSTIEYWQDVGTSPLPYSRIQGATQTYGLAAKSSRAVVENTLFFLAKNPQGHIKVMSISNGYAPQRVSTDDVDDFINDMTSFTDAAALTYVAYGHTMYQLTFPTDGRTLLYDTTTKVWQEAQTGLDLIGRHQAELGISFNGQNIAGDYSSGSMYTFDEYTFTDNGVAIKRQVASKHIRNGGNPLTLSELVLDIETGVGLQASQGNDPQIAMERSKDGGRTYGQPRLTSMGKAGQYLSPKVRWRRLGTSDDHVFRFTVTDPVKFVVTGGSVS